MIRSRSGGGGRLWRSCEVLGRDEDEEEDAGIFGTGLQDWEDLQDGGGGRGRWWWGFFGLGGFEEVGEEGVEGGAEEVGGGAVPGVVEGVGGAGEV
jgi:hypothetical protein